MNTRCECCGLKEDYKALSVREVLRREIKEELNIQRLKQKFKESKERKWK